MKSGYCGPLFLGAQSALAELFSVQARPVGVAAVQQVAAARLHYGVERAMVVTITPFVFSLVSSAGCHSY